MVPCGSLGHAAGPLADNDDQLRLVVHFGRLGRQLDRILGTADSGGKFAEHHRLVAHGRACFRGVIGVVQADADDLLRIANWRQQLDACQRCSRRSGGNLGRARQGGVAALE
jgi:hypothetical protein